MTWALVALETGRNAKAKSQASTDASGPPSAIGPPSGSPPSGSHPPQAPKSAARRTPPMVDLPRERLAQGFFGVRMAGKTTPRPCRGATPEQCRWAPRSAKTASPSLQPPPTPATCCPFFARTRLAPPWAGPDCRVDRLDAPPSTESLRKGCRVGGRRGARGRGGADCAGWLSPDRSPRPSTSPSPPRRSSNRTCRFPASGSRTDFTRGHSTAGGFAARPRRGRDAPRRTQTGLFRRAACASFSGSSSHVPRRGCPRCGTTDRRCRRRSSPPIP